MQTMQMKIYWPRTKRGCTGRKKEKERQARGHDRKNKRRKYDVGYRVGRRNTRQQKREAAAAWRHLRGWPNRHALNMQGIPETTAAHPAEATKHYERNDPDGSTRGKEKKDSPHSNVAASMWGHKLSWSSESTLSSIQVIISKFLLWLQLTF
jgi:hypothetical protein